MMMEVAAEMMELLGSLCIAFVIGLMIGWSWKPRWAVLESGRLTSCVAKLLDTSLPSSPLKGFASPFRFNSFVIRSSNSEPCAVDQRADKHRCSPSLTSTEYDDCTALQPNEELPNVASLVTEEDLAHLYKLVEVKDEGPAWIHMMDRSTRGMSYQAWRREPKTGPPQYRSRTVFEDATPEMVRDLFWDDDFRPKWDDMLVKASIVDVCPTTGAMVVHWTRKFPFFCSDREYVIGRRIWESGRSYYCVTKGIPYPYVPRRDKPRRVDLYYSSFCIRAVESRAGDGQLTACEVLLFHHEEMGIPWEIAKLGVRQGMWSTVKKIEPGLRAYQKERASGAPVSRPAFMARINTKITPEFFASLGGPGNLSEIRAERPLGRNIPKFLIIGGAIVIACSIDRGLLSKAFIFGVGRRFGNVGKKL
ncbi:hypothetical protein Tsubulata_011130 [Turnera subulata]|uniref:START domain-containing protein n=1 Tax=Turnera subulata TaxID=218843 RepID=A0A9Q0J7G6_9ROSI|nr:hypothetical protein Tsubulata_011130 [Turnera subulata]